jgi:hypothetical protein
MPLSIETLVAFEVVHVNVAWFPGVMVVGETERLAVGGDACTVTVATAVVVPFAPVAVKVYSVVEDGVTLTDPDTATVPTPLLIVTVEAFAVVHDKVAELPDATVAGEALRVAVGTTVDVPESELPPPQPEMNPAQTQAAAIIKRIMAKYTLHHP